MKKEHVQREVNIQYWNGLSLIFFCQSVFYVRMKDLYVPTKCLCICEIWLLFVCVIYFALLIFCRNCTNPMYETLKKSASPDTEIYQCKWKETSKRHLLGLWCGLVILIFISISLLAFAAYFFIEQISEFSLSLQWTSALNINPFQRAPSCHGIYCIVNLNDTLLEFYQNYVLQNFMSMWYFFNWCN